MSSSFWSAEEFDRRAQRLYECGDLDGAGELLREGLGRYPHAPELQVSFGYVRLAQEEYALARRAFETALAAEPDHEDALVGLGESLLRLGERGRGFRAFERVLELGFDTDLDLMLSIGRALYREELYEQAERFFRKAARADEGSSEAAADLGYALHRQGKTNGARGWLNRALSLDPDNHEARAWYGNLLYDERRVEEAREQLTRIPPERLWDPLTVWRAIELLRGGRADDAADDGRLDPYLERLEELLVEPEPEERLIAAVERDRDLSAGPGEVAGRGQFDLFRPGSDGVRDGERTPEPDPAVRHAGERPGRGGGGRRAHRSGEVEGVVADWAGIVRAMCESSMSGAETIEEFMRDTARHVHSLTGILIPDDDPEAFLKATARAGVLHIDGSGRL
ncbi:MAG: tetratricopeptide repeat protein [Gemmatimonadota bacterium]